jgi:hypothetical protein
VLLASCATLRVRSDFDSDVDFASYRTYGWLEVPVGASRAEAGAANPFAYNSLLDKRVRKAVDQELAARGYQRLESGAVDFRLNYHVILKDKLVASASDFGAFHSHYPYPYDGFVGGVDVQVMQFQEGTFVLDVIDVGRDQLAWRGWAVGRNPDGNYDEREIWLAVRRILERFPPPPAGSPGGRADPVRTLAHVSTPPAEPAPDRRAKCLSS